MSDLNIVAFVDSKKISIDIAIYAKDTNVQLYVSTD